MIEMGFDINLSPACDQTPFQFGLNGIFTAPASGTLYVAVNDFGSAYNDNIGLFTININAFSMSPDSTSFSWQAVGTFSAGSYPYTATGSVGDSTYGPDYRRNPYGTTLPPNESVPAVSGFGYIAPGLYG